MTIRYQCEECGSVLNIRDEKAGTQGRCPKCKGEFRVPDPDGGSEAQARPLVIASAPAHDQQPEDAAAGPDSHFELSTALADPATDGGDSNLSDDEIEKILESGPAPKRGGYLVIENDEAIDEDADDWAKEDEGEVRRAKGKPPRRGAAPAAAPPATTAAGIAKSLMARGDKGGGGELDPQRATRAFGQGERDVTDEEGYSVKEVVLYFSKYIGPAAAGIVLALGIYWWWYSQWLRGDLPPLAPVSGVVTLDGAPLALAYITFLPEGADPKKQDLNLGSSSALTDANGKYTLSYTALAPGAVIGKHRVQITSTNQTGVQILPPHYNERTTLTAEVPKGGNRQLNFDLKSAKETSAEPAVGGFNPAGQ
ncbi:MAG: hypothetical protein ACKV0T_18115 [Planctomycetales bacterium]